MNPTLSLKATERMRASVVDGDGDGSRMVNFDVSISIKNRLDAPDLIFDISAPEDAAVENELQAMGAEERSKYTIAMLATGIYLNSGAKGGGLSMGAALNSVLQSQINSLAGGIKGANISVGVEDRTSAETGDTQKDFSFRYSQRFFNDRVQIVIGGKVSTVPMPRTMRNHSLTIYRWNTVLMRRVLDMSVYSIIKTTKAYSTVR